MPIRRNAESGIWWIDIRAPGIPRIRRSAGTTEKQAAQEYHDTIKAQLWRQIKMGEQPDRMLDEAAVRFLKLSEGQRDYATKLRHVDYWRDQFPGRTVRSLTADAIFQALPTHRTYRHRPTIVLTPATKNRYLSTIRRILSLCVDWGWVNRLPKLATFTEPDIRVRWEPAPVIIRLIKAMSLEWMREVSLFAVATGMRENEVLSLRWAQLDMARCHAWVTASGAKSKKARAVPLNADAMAVLQRRRGKHNHLVFTRSSVPDKDAIQIGEIDRRVLARACAAVGIEDFHFHDLRHTWASWHVQAGTPLMVLKELGGWETIQMVQKYAHLATSHMSHHADAVTFWSQPALGKEKPPCRAALSA